MSLKSTQDDEKAAEERAMNSSNNEGASEPKEAMPSTAVIQMTIQPQAAAPVVFPDSLAAALADLPLAHSDVGPAGSSSYDYVAELEPPPLARSEPPRPAFSYRSDAALAHHYAPVEHSVATYDYADEGELALEWALAAMEQTDAVAGEVAGAPAGAREEQGEEILEESLDAAALYDELERGFDLARYEGVQLSSDPSLAEYSDNSAMLQSELFELGQGGFVANELAIGGEQEFISGGLQLTPPEGVQLSPPESLQLPPAELQMVLPQGLQIPQGLQMVALEGLDLMPPEPAAAVEHPGPSRSRAHAVQIYPGEGEGEPQTCYITNLPTLAFEETFFEENVQSEAMSLRASGPPAAGAARSEHMLRQLLGAPEDNEGDVSSSPSSAAASKDSTSGTITAALRSAALSFANDDSNTQGESERANSDSPTDATADLSEAMEQLSVSESEPDIPKAKETESVAASAAVEEMKPDSELMESNLKITSPIIITEPTPASSSQAGDSVDQPEIKEPSQVASSENISAPVLVEPSEEHAPAEYERATDTAVDVDSDASDAPELMVSSRKRKLRAATTAIKTKKAKKLPSTTKPKRKHPDQPPAAFKSDSIQFEAKIAQKAAEKGYSTAIVPIESASESTISSISSEDSNEVKTLSSITENAAKSACDVEKSTGAAGGDIAPEDHTAGAAGDDNAVAAGDYTAATATGDDTVSEDADAAAAGPSAAPAIVQAQQSGSSEKAKNKRAASAQNAQTKQKQAKKVRTAPEVPTTTMVLRSRSHMK